MLAVVGGPVGALIGMYAFRHETMKAKFWIDLPVILPVRIFGAAHLLRKAGLAFG